MNIFTNIGFVRCRGLCGAEVYGPRRKKKRALSLSQYKIPNRYTDVGK